MKIDFTNSALIVLFVAFAAGCCYTVGNKYYEVRKQEVQIKQTEIQQRERIYRNTSRLLAAGFVIFIIVKAIIAKKASDIGVVNIRLLQ